MIEVGKDHPPFHKINEKLEELEQKYKFLLHHSSHGVILAHNYPPLLAWANAAMANLLGHQSQPLQSPPIQALKTLFQTKDYKNFLIIYRDCLAGKPVPLRQPIQAVIKDNSVVWLEYSLVKVEHQGQPAVLTLFMDISYRKKLDEVLQTHQQEYERQLEDYKSQLTNNIIKLKKKEEQLIHQKEELFRVSQELWDTNNAITVLARNLKKSREEAEIKVAQTIRKKITPILNFLKEEKPLEKYKTDLEILSAHLEDMSLDGERPLKIASSLSTQELRVAALIKNGFSSHSISKELHISIDTVKTHRKNIRKKLKIDNLKTNLCSFLKG